MVMAQKGSRKDNGGGNPYTDLLRQMKETRVSDQKKVEALHDHRTMHTLGEEMTWLKRRRTKPYEKVKHKAIHLKHLRIWFDSYDQDKSGTISVEELAWPMLVLGYASTLDEVHALLKSVDFNGDGTLSFDEFVELLNQSDAKTDVHPLEKLVQMANSGDMGEPVLSLQTLIPSFQRKHLLASLMAYGDSSRSPRLRHEVAAREANDAILRRANIALQTQRKNKLVDAPPIVESARRHAVLLPPMMKPKMVKKKSTVARQGSGGLTEARVLREGERLRQSLEAKDGSTALFLESIRVAAVAAQHDRRRRVDANDDEDDGGLPRLD
ncbi:Aste57867_23339 [Aphanomyces stellatus]|uniref:Aste57867_23339 protein n=1 Tax=Aphanomyces stellatus TaxID=120398 RepID=A0A485LME3_9STRA|nr:hypothetical protein As57867_023268 [Aphanomyces stellatus]VFT99984.1 Aste57867_23339 [Aphanomyces stellatus]